MENFNIPYAPVKSDEEKEKIRQRVKKHWETQSEETRQKRLDRTYSEKTKKSFAKRFTENNPSKDPDKLVMRKKTKLENGSEKFPEFWQEIYDQFWDENRNSKALKDSVCKKYGVNPGTLHTLINGGMEMNLPQATKDSHHQRLYEWHERWGDYRFIYSITPIDDKTYFFNNLADAGKWFVKHVSIAIKLSKQGRLNYGNVVYGYFNMCAKIGTLKKGKYAGWSFTREERHASKGVK
jgi:hypothetical protein